MHQIIRLIVYGKDEKEAREQAEIILNENLAGEDKPFDYGTFFDDETVKASGKARWGNLPAIVLANSKEGKKLIDDGMKFTKENFKERLKEVKELIDSYSEDELFEEIVTNLKTKILDKLDDNKGDFRLRMFKYYCHCLGQYKGSEVFLYSNDGEGIKDSKHLKNVLTKWKSIYGVEEKEGKKNPYKNLKVWCIPVDVHH